MSTSDTTLNTFLDFTSTFMFPIISTYDIIINIINIIIFSKKSLKDIIFKYYRINAISNILYLLIIFFFFVIRCGMYCSFTNTYPAQIFNYVFFTYIKGIFAIFSICIQITLSIYRLLIVCNRNTDFLKNKMNTIIISLIIFSAVFYLPNLFTKTILATAKNVTTINSSNETSFDTIYTYTTVNNSIGNSDIGKLLIVITTIIRSFISLAVIITIDIITLIRLKMLENTRSKILSINNSF